MSKGVLVADDVSSRPPAADVRMCGIGDDDPSKSAIWSFLDIQLQFVHAFEIKHQAALAAIDLKPVIVFAPGGEIWKWREEEG